MKPYGKELLGPKVYGCPYSELFPYGYMDRLDGGLGIGMRYACSSRPPCTEGVSSTSFGGKTYYA
ncbi:MAG: hypothetical protein QW220_06075 [Candidatus Bathyarchaeia archaeon]